MITKTLHYVFILLFAIAFTACDKEDDVEPETETETPEEEEPEEEEPPVPVKLMTFNIINNSGPRKWVFMHSETGELLAIKELTATSGTVEVSTTKKFTTFDYTIFTSEVSAGAQTVSTFTTYKSISGGRTVDIGEHAAAEVVGKVDITVTNYYEPQWPMTYTSAGLTDGAFNKTSVIGSCSFSQNLTADNKRVLITAMRAGKMVSYLTPVVTPGASITVDFNNFTLFQNYLDLTFLKGVGLVYGIRSDEPGEYSGAYNTGGISDYDFKQQAITGFDAYRTILFDWDYNFFYEKRGTLATSFSLPSWSITYPDKSMTNFKADINIPFDFYSTSWGLTKGSLLTSWKVLATSTGSTVIPFAIPEEIKSLLPGLSKNELTWSGTSFHQSNGTFTYSDHLDHEFNHTVKDKYEILIVNGR